MAYIAKNVDNTWVIIDDNGNTHNIICDNSEVITEEEAISLVRNLIEPQ